jgi:hypothetical protein
VILADREREPSPSPTNNPAPVSLSRAGLGRVQAPPADSGTVPLLENCQVVPTRHISVRHIEGAAGGRVRVSSTSLPGKAEVQVPQQLPLPRTSDHAAAGRGFSDPADSERSEPPGVPLGGPGYLLGCAVSVARREPVGPGGLGCPAASPSTVSRGPASQSGSPARRHEAQRGSRALKIHSPPVPPLGHGHRSVVPGRHCVT